MKALHVKSSQVKFKLWSSAYFMVLVYIHLRLLQEARRLQPLRELQFGLCQARQQRDLLFPLLENV
jgi:hypothetical protein